MEFDWGVQQFNEENIVSTDVNYLKGIYDASIPQEEETESHVDGLHSAETRDSGSSHLVTIIYCTKVDEDSYLDIINNKSRRREAKEQTQLRDNKNATADDEEVSLT